MKKQTKKKKQCLFNVGLLSGYTYDKLLYTPQHTKRKRHEIHIFVFGVYVG